MCVFGVIGASVLQGRGRGLHRGGAGAAGLGSEEAVPGSDASEMSCSLETHDRSKMQRSFLFVERVVATNWARPPRGHSAFQTRVQVQ